DVQSLRDELEERERDLRSREREAAAHLESVRREEKTLLRRWQEESDAIRRDVYRQLRAELKTLRQKSQSDRDAKSVEDLAGSVLQPTERRPEPQAIDPEKLSAGDTVRHRRFHFEGTLRSIDGERAEVVVKGKKMQLDVSDLDLVEKGGRKGSAGKKMKKPRKSKPTVESEAEPEVSAELNLIGQRVEEALEESDRFLDRALLDGRGAVRLIHGHGTGRLKNAVRDHLRTHPAVRKWRPGGAREGGDGATIAILDR
ncbi:MAG: Smr/MutS family protein, partial [Thermoanaerobaculia bacterium]|nr:Smr/MutS family protein [Thermoanaerobaculia bacterium]